MKTLVSNLIAILALIPAGAVQASQGPGVAAGTASPLVQQAMAIAIYGGSALVIAFGLFGALRQR